MKCRFGLVMLLLLFSPVLHGQDEELHEMKLLARPTADSIMLRWAPSTYRLWLVGNKYGYHVTRSLLVKDGELLESAGEEQLTTAPLKPRPLDQWEALANQNDYAAVAAQCIYGENMEVTSGTGNPSMFEIVNRASEQESRFGFALFSADQSPEVARYSGLWLTDKNVRKGEKYLYSVYPAFVPPGMKVDTAFFFTGPDEYLPLPSPFDLRAEPGDKMVTLTWDRKYQSEIYNSFWIEKSADNCKTFMRLNDVPMVNTTPEGYDESEFHLYIDTLANNKKTYHYRVIGISTFGELSPPSDTVVVKGKSKITSIPELTLQQGDDGQSVRIQWEYPNQANEVIEGFRIFRSTKFAEGYVKVVDSIPVVSKNYVDRQPLMSGYYRIQAFNSDGNGPYSIPQMFQFVDSIPPVAPVELEAKADTTGMVELTWQANSEPDIFGYRVYRANSREGAFSQITKEPVNVIPYVDHITLKTLTKKVYYKVVAVDQRQNESDYSAILEVERPDIVPPAPPLISHIASSDSGVVIRWVKSPSNDVSKLLLYRNRAGSRDWQLLKLLPPDSTISYHDVPPLTGTSYRYIMLAVDEAGNESRPTKPATGKRFESKKIDQWIEPKVKIDKRNEVILVSWDAPKHLVSRYLIYKKDARGQWTLYDSVEGKQTRFTDHSYQGKVEEYLIKLVQP
ncbi:hypothetical protein DMA11_11965 [Marinilabiliaceae bacterium JC017]|nr:hypothetical protein DMA11_11965 [Marinilabiliaceae bacterium JC017]